MASFKGFKPSGVEKIARSMGYQGPMNQFNDFLNQDPARIMQMSEYTKKAMNMAKGGAVRKMFNGGFATSGGFPDSGDMNPYYLSALFARGAEGVTPSVSTEDPTTGTKSSSTNVTTTIPTELPESKVDTSLPQTYSFNALQSGKTQSDMTLDKLSSNTSKPVDVINKREYDKIPSEKTGIKLGNESDYAKEIIAQKYQPFIGVEFKDEEQAKQELAKYDFFRNELFKRLDPESDDSRNVLGNAYETKLQTEGLNWLKRNMPDSVPPGRTWSGLSEGEQKAALQAVAPTLYKDFLGSKDLNTKVVGNNIDDFFQSTEYLQYYNSYNPQDIYLGPKGTFTDVMSEERDPDITDITAQRMQQPFVPEGAEVDAKGIPLTQDQLVDPNTGQLIGDIITTTYQTLTDQATVPTEKAAKLADTIKSIQSIKDTLPEYEAAQLDSLTKTVEAQLGKFRDGSLPAEQLVDQDTLERVKEIQRVVSEAEKVKAATAADVGGPAKSTAAQSTFVSGVDAAKFGTPTPEAKAQDQYKLDTLKGAVSTVQKEELPVGLPDDIIAEQAKAQQILEKTKFDFAQGKVTEDQVAQAQDAYDAVKANTAKRIVESLELASAKGGDLKAEQSDMQQIKNKIDFLYAQGKMTPDQYAQAQDKYKEIVTNSAISRVDRLTELVDAKGGDLSAEQSEIQQIKKDIDFLYAQGNMTPEQYAQAQDQYAQVITKAASRTVDNKELIKDQTIGLTAEQSAEVEINKQKQINAAQTTVKPGEIANAEDAYNYDSANSAKLLGTTVEDAAKLGQMPSTDAAKASYESGIVAQQGAVSNKELIDVAADNLQISEPAQAVAATVTKLNDSARMSAAQGSFSQMLAETKQGYVDAKSTVQGQLSDLMEQFNNGTPAWAAGAIRQANAAIAARGLGGSSMAGAAIVQAAMESATPIAVQDAQAFFNMNMQNLNNRQQVALTNAAAQQNIELQNLSNRQQAALQNSTNAFALQSESLSNEQAVVLANLQVRAAVQNKNLDVRTQASIANAARYAEVNNINLNNKQQANLARSAENLQVDLANLSNSQQTALSNLQVQASLTGQILSNEQQMAVLQSQQNFDAAEFDATAKQQAFMQDASARAALEGRALDIRAQTSLFNASRIAEVNDVNLSNQQAAILQSSAQNLQVDLQDASQRQQTALANAQLRAALQGKVLDNKTQTAILNAEKYAEANNITVSNKQQAFVQDSIAKLTLEGKAVDARQQAMLYNVGRIANVQDLNITNEQAALIADSSSQVEIEVQNLSVRQQTALANAQLRSALQGKVLDNNQQAAIINAARFAEANNITVSNQQQAFVQDAVAKLTLEGKAVDIRQQAMLYNVARVADVQDLNISNEQQALISESSANVEIEVQNLSSRQQTALANAQLRASLQGKVLDNDQQVNILNATRYAEANNITVSNQQQGFIQDAIAKLTLEGKAVDIRQQTELYNVARAADVQDLNITNEQAALIAESTSAVEVDVQNLSARQQTELANAQLRSALQGKVLDSQTQAEIIRASRFAEANNITVSNKQQAFVQDFISRTTLEGKSMDARQQTAIFNAANLVEERGIELTNEQQTRLFNTTNNLQVDMTNTSNRQQTALANAQLDAAMRGQELGNLQQTAVLNAEKFAEANNLTFNSQQQATLANSQMMQSVALADLDSRQATALQKAATIASMDMADLNNRQQAEVINAQNFLQMDMSNLSNEQQKIMFDVQARVQSIFSDQAAENAAEQFNATSENQVNQFFESLINSTNQFNTAQTNANGQFNADQANVMQRFTAELMDVRDRFNASNELIIEQNNAQWRRTVATADTAAVNRAQEINALALLDMSNQAYANVWQDYQDTIEYAFTATDNQLDREMNITLQELRNSGAVSATKAGKDSGFAWSDVFSTITQVAVAKIVND